MKKILIMFFIFIFIATISCSKNDNVVLKIKENISSIFSRSKKGESSILRLKGSIDAKYPITLTIDKSNWEGEYYYDKNKKIIELKGSMDKNKLRLVERADGKMTGEFYGILEKDGSYKGTWISADGKRKLPFELAKEGEAQKVISQKKTIEIEEMVGKFSRDKHSNIELILKGTKQFYVEGFTVGETGNFGQLENLVAWYYADEMKIIHEDTEMNYVLTITIKDKDNFVVEENGNLPHGMGAGFNGEYKRVK